MIIGSEIIFYSDAGSTNTIAADLIRSEKPREGTVIHTDFQSAGRGRKGNTWLSEKGKNLLFSIILYPDFISPGDQFRILMSISLGICDFLREYAREVTVKWPNDIYVSNDKIAGMLIENSVKGGQVESCIAGIGLNLNQVSFPMELPNPVSLKLITGTDHDTMHCLKILLSKLDRRYKKLFQGKAGEIKNEYLSSLFRFGEWHNFRTGTGVLYGRIIGVTDQGCLVIEDQWKKTSEFLFGEIEYML